MARRMRERAPQRRAWRGRRKASPDAGEPLGDALRTLLKAMGGTPERAGLQRLWDNWEGALGAELAGMAQPLGHHADRQGRAGAGAASDAGAILLVGAEDAMLLQELRFRGGEILERVNAFLGHAYFSRVQVSLPLGRSAPETSRAAPGGASEPAREAPEPSASGRFLDDMDSTSPVARCYARFVRRAAGNVSRESSDDLKKEKSNNDA